MLGAAVEIAALIILFLKCSDIYLETYQSVHHDIWISSDNQ